MRGLFNRHFWKFLVGFLAIMIVGFFALVWANVYHNGKTADEKTGEKYFKDLKKAYDEDTYGGKTPEETLQLFIDALKKGDIDLAAKYFVVEKQEEWRESLERVKEGNKLDSMLRDLGTAERGQDLNESSAIFSIVNQNNNVIAMINIAKTQNGTWKILDL